jgi:hypothetical protein
VKKAAKKQAKKPKKVAAKKPAKALPAPPPVGASVAVTSEGAVTVVADEPETVEE